MGVERLTSTKKKILNRLYDVAPNGELIAPEIGESTRIKPGSLYPSLYGLVEAELIEGEWTTDTDSGRPAKVYRLTPNGVLLAKGLDEGTIDGIAWRQFLPEMLR